MKKGACFFGIMLLSIVFFYSCSQEKNSSIHPVAIDVWKPYENQSFRMIDTLAIVASFRSQLDLKNASIKILNGDKSNFGDILNETPLSTYLDVDMQIPIIELGFEKGGKYYLHFSGNNEEISMTRLIPIEVSDPDDSLKKLIAIKEKNSGVSVEIYSVDLNPESELFLNSDYSSSTVASDLQYVFVEGSYNAGINYIDANTTSSVFEIPAVITPGFPYFMDIAYDDETIYATTYDGGIYGYNNSGTQIYTTSTPTNKVASKVFTSENYIYTLMHTHNNLDSAIGVFYKDTETMRKDVLFEGLFIGAVNTFEDFILILSYNDDEKYVIKEFHPDFSSFDLLKTSNSYQITDIEKIDSDNFILLSKSHILQYERSTNTLFELAENNHNVKKLRYNFVDKNVYAYSQDSLFILDATTFDVEKSLYLQNDSIVNIHLLYNK